MTVEEESKYYKDTPAVADFRKEVCRTQALREDYEMVDLVRSDMGQINFEVGGQDGMYDNFTIFRVYRNDQYIRVHVYGDRERKARKHAAGIDLDRLIDKLADLREVGDLRYAFAHFLLGIAQPQQHIAPHTLMTDGSKRHIDTMKCHPVNLFLPAFPVPESHGVRECAIIEVIS